MRIEGQKTAAFEIVDALGDAPDLHVLPVGNGGNISAYWRGYTQYAEAGHAARTPRMWAFQAAGAAPLVLGRPVPMPETVATAIRIGNPASTEPAVAARDESGGLFAAVTRRGDPGGPAFPGGSGRRFRRARIGRRGGGSAVQSQKGAVEAGQQIVITVTGHGLKDVDTALSSRGPIAAEIVPAELGRVADVCGFGRD